MITSLPLPGSSPISAIGVNTQTNRIYVTNEDTDNITVVNGATNTIVTTISLPATSYPRDVAIDEGANRVLLAERIPSVVCVINGGTNAVVDTVHTPSFPSPVALNPLLYRVYTACATNQIVVYDAATLTERERVGVGAQRIMDDLVTVGDRLYVPDPQNQEIVVFRDVGATTPVRTTTWGRLKRRYR